MRTQVAIIVDGSSVTMIREIKLKKTHKKNLTHTYGSTELTAAEKWSKGPNWTTLQFVLHLDFYLWEAIKSL